MEPLTIQRQPHRGGRDKRHLQHRNSYSGVPQGGIASPILANIYLHELDQFMAGEIAAFNKGKSRAINPAYRRAF